MKKYIILAVAFAVVYGICHIVMQFDPNNIWASAFRAIITMVWMMAKQIVLTIVEVVV